MLHTVRHILEVKGKDVWEISPDATVFEALRLMADKDVGALLVVRGDTLEGIISERDYARKVILLGKTSQETRVSEIMETALAPVHPDQTIEECMELMTRCRTRHLPVLDDSQVLGVVSIGDVVKDIIYKQRETIKQLEEQKPVS